MENIFTIIPALSAIIVAYIAFKAWREGQKRNVREQIQRVATLFPVAGFEVSTLPPYSDDNQLTEIIVKNIGNCRMDGPMTLVFYSWGGPAIIQINWGEDDILAPNESKIFNIRLPDPPLDAREQEIIIQCMCLHPLTGDPVMWRRNYAISYGR